MFAPFLLFQLATAATSTASNYATPALATFIAAASVANRNPPASLAGYRGHVESELSLIVRDTLGREHIAQVEQVALEAVWRSELDYGLHVVGYRSASVGVPYSALSFARSWTVPFLYGDRLTLGVDVARIGQPRSRGNGAKGASGSRESQDSGPAPIHAVHPLATDRDHYYRFAGGDTIAFVHSGDRIVPIMQVRVTPVLDSVPRDSSVSAFVGDLDFDATRHEIVRMRGRLVTKMAVRRGLRAALTRLPGVVAVAFVEFVNAEVDGQYWLPQFQRTEFQATFAPLGGERSVFRLVSRFTELTADTRPAVLSGSRQLDSAVRIHRDPNDSSQRVIDRSRPALSYAAADSISRFDHWLQPLGTATASVAASDFDEFLPDPWRPSGPPRFELAPTRLDEVFRFDRVEGTYTGVALRLRFRDAAPGLSTQAYGGWAWTESTPRGGASINYSRERQTVAARIERSLASTNDFGPPLEAGTIGFGGLFGADDQDYVDRRTASMSLTRHIGSLRNGLIAAEGGFGADGGESARLSRSPFRAGPFRINRGSATGRYVRGAAMLEWHPGVTGLFLEPGAGFDASYEIGRGQLNWQRAEVTVAVRQSIKDLVIAGRAQGGIVIGRNVPPQQLFEMGGEGALPGYGYKQFAGDRAATGGVLVSYPLPVLRRPWRLVRSLMLPGLGPGVAAGVESGWVEASSASVLEAIRRLDPLVPTACIDSSTPTCPAALSVPSGRVRATVDARLTFFGGLVGVGVARPVDTSAPWRLVFRFAQEY